MPALTIVRAGFFCIFVLQKAEPALYSFNPARAAKLAKIAGLFREGARVEHQ